MKPGAVVVLVNSAKKLAVVVAQVVERWHSCPSKQCSNPRTDLGFCGSELLSIYSGTALGLSNYGKYSVLFFPVSYSHLPLKNLSM